MKWESLRLCTRAPTVENAGGHRAPCQQPLPSLVSRDSKNERVVNRSRANSEALRWLVQIQTSRSIDHLWPAFEAWLLGDRRNRAAFMQASRAWSQWDRLGTLLSKEGGAVSEPLCALERQKTSARTQRDLLWLTLAVSLMAFLLV